MDLNKLSNFIITDTHNIIWGEMTIWFDGKGFFVGGIYTTNSNVSMFRQNVRPTKALAKPLSSAIMNDVSASDWDFNENGNISNPYFLIPKTDKPCIGLSLTDKEVYFIVGLSDGGFSIYYETIDQCIELFGECENKLIHDFLVDYKLKGNKSIYINPLV